ncbi:MAG: branched-chain amino acid ABC transporter permease [Actinomycetota bacterium]|nr:branched-chain amino acid ABC transporter permease [Actinomycetota bacterium]
MVKSAVDLRTYLDRNYPGIATRVPNSVVTPLNVVWRGYQRLGYFRYALIGLIMASLPYLVNHGIIPYLHGSYGNTILVQTGYTILLAIGLNVVVGLAGLLDLGYVAFFMLGAYTTAMMTASGGPTQFHFVEWPVWAALPFALLVAMAAGVAIGLPTLRLRGDYLAIVTLGFHEMVILVMTNLKQTNGPRGIASIPGPAIHNFFGIKDFDFGVKAILSPEYYWWWLLIPAILLAVLMVRHLENSRVGRYWTAIREDEVAAAAMGVPVTKMKVLAFVIGASTSGVAGWIYAGFIGYVAPNSFPLLQSILVLAAITIGGLGSIAGAVLGGILIVAVPEMIRTAAGGHTVFGFDPVTGRVAIFGALLIVIMIFRPGGLLAARRRRTELTEPGADKSIGVHDEVMLSTTAAEEDLRDVQKTQPPGATDE